MERYPAYKNSGVPWLGDVPEHWETIRTKHLFNERVEKGYPDEPLLAATQTKGVIPKSLYENRTVLAQKDLHLLKLVEVGDFVISLRSFQGGIEYAYYRGIISPAYTVMNPRNRLHSDYFRHLAKSKKFINLLQTCVTGIREGQNINYDLLRKTPMPVPPLPEQQQIARYLDWKTSKISKFIRGKKKLIELLKEQKQNIINQAVSKGINPHVRMKDSGVEWLGEIPEHWEVRKLRNILKPLSVRNRPDLPLLSVTREKGVIVRNVDDLEENHNFIPDDLSNYKVVYSGQFAMNKMKAWQGSYGVSAFDGIVSPAYYIFKIIYEIVPEFFHMAIRSKMYVPFFIKASDGVRIGQWDINLNRMKEIPFFIPNKKEQAEIIKYIEDEIPLIDKTISKAEREIELIQEYRTRLVSDVVTGKIYPQITQINADFDAVNPQITQINADFDVG